MSAEEIRFKGKLLGVVRSKDESDDAGLVKSWMPRLVRDGLQWRVVFDEEE